MDTPNAMFPDTQSGTGTNYRGAIWDKPPELRGAHRIWICDHRHYGHDDAIVCAVQEMRRRWVTTALGVPAGWGVWARWNPGRGNHRGQLAAYVIRGPRGQDIRSGYRFTTEKSALTAGAKHAIKEAGRHD